MLAMLPAMTWTCRSIAAMPVAAVSSARIRTSPQTLPAALSRYSSGAAGRRRLRQLRQRIAALVALLLQDVGDVGVGLRDLDHAGDLGHRIDVGFFDRALHHLRALRRRPRIDSGRRLEGRAAILLQQLRLVEADQLQLAAGRVGGTGALAHGDDAAWADYYVVIGVRERDRPGIAEHRVTVAADELAGAVDAERAIAGVAHARGGLHREV